MPTVGNTPKQQTVLRLEARKSFALALWIEDQNGRKLNISGTEIRIIAKKRPYTDETPNLILNDTAITSNPEVGYARFELQASDLDWDPGEYDYVVTLLDDGYSSVLLRGVIDLQQNTDFDTVDDQYSGVNPSTSLKVVMRESVVIHVDAGPTLSPGTTSFTDADKAKLDALGELTGLPPGGVAREVLTKLSDLDGNADWAHNSPDLFLLEDPEREGFFITVEGDALNATGIPEGYQPTANGADGWSWEVDEGSPDALTLDDVEDGEERFALAPAEREAIGDLGTASTHAEEDFLPSTGIDADKIVSGVVDEERLPKVTGHLGFSSGTAAPTGGEDGDLYFQYTA